MLALQGVKTDCLVAFDAGTGSGRCVVYDACGRPLASARERFHYRMFSHPDVPLVRGFDLDPGAFWGSLAGCARRALAELPPGVRIRGVAATSQREGCVFLDRAGEVLYAGPNLDARATLEGFEAQQAFGIRRLHATTGHLPACVFPLARYLWFRKHHDAGRVATVLMLSDWITERLSGARVAEPSNAAESMLFDVGRRTWSDELLAAFEIPAAVLPALHPSGAPVGAVHARAAADTGIPEGTPVFTGGADTQCALLGSGAVAAGDTAAILGTTCPVQTVTDTPVLDPATNLWTSCHVVPDHWVLESNAGETGGAYRWLLRLLFGVCDAAAHETAEALAAAAAGGRVLCYLGPIVFDLRKMNPFRPGGVLFRFPIVPADRPERGDVLRGFLESVACAVRANCDQLATVAGRPATSLAVSGGMVASPTLVRLLADTLAVPVEVARVPESASLGCAVLAAAAAGVHPSLGDAAAAMTARTRVDPAPDAVKACDERYRKWRELYGTLEQSTV
jgi:sugar (pentulose or hexulose) kinase